MLEKDSLELKAADALKTIEWKHKLFRGETSKEDLLRPFLDMLERAGKPAANRRPGGSKGVPTMKNKRFVFGWVFVWLAVWAPFARADDTGYKNPASAVGQFTNPTNVFTSNNVYAQDGTVGDTMAAYDFSFNVPAGATINGIQVDAEMDLPGISGFSSTIDVRLSWNGGAGWTAFKTNTVTDDQIEQYYQYGGAIDTWGRSWMVDETNNTNFRCALKYAAEDNGPNTVSFDHVRAKIFYTPASTGSPRRNRLIKHGKNWTEVESEATDSTGIRAFVLGE